MATLTETAYIMRNIIKFTGLGIIAYIIVSQSLNLAYKLYLYYNPPPPPPPTLGFGALPQIEFPEIGGYDLMFDLETPSGTFPSFPDRSVVFYMPYQRQSLLALDIAAETANKLGFKNPAVALTNEVYQWKMSLPSPVVLEQNISNGSYTYNYQWQTDKSLLTSKNIPGQEQTVRFIEQYLNRANFELEDVSVDDAVITYTKASGNRMIPAVSISDADFVQVDLFRSELKVNLLGKTETFEVVTPDPNRGIIRIYLSGSNMASKKIISVEHNYYPIDYNRPETYLLKPVEQAWEELKAGQAYVPVNEDDEADLIQIRRIYLGYYDTYKAQKYLQPIYIFKGDNGGSDEFIAYVHAINDEQVKK